MKRLECKDSPYFEKNLGQLPSEIKYKIKSNGYTTFFTEDKLIVSLPSNIENTVNVFYMKLNNKNKEVKIKGEDKNIGILNYFIGTNEYKWITNIPTYSKVKYENIYENIDLYYYTNNNNLEYDFILSKDANPKDISISFQGLDNIEIDEYKNIVLSIGDIKAFLLKPEVYQIINNTKTYVECEYIIDEYNDVSFLVSDYEKEYDLVLDPVLVLDYSTYLGVLPSSGIYKNAIAVDGGGNIYVTGKTREGYPTTPGAYQTTIGGFYDVFVTKFSRDKKSLIYSTYIGGTGSDAGNGIAIDSFGCAHIVGSTSGNYPTTSGTYQTIYGGGDYDVFVTKLNKDGTSLLYSTYIGGKTADYGNAIALDSEGYAYITGQTSGSYPTTSGAYQTDFLGNYDAFVTKLSKDGKSLVYSTYIGGSSFDSANAIDVDSDGCAYVSGRTGGNYPTTTGAYQTTYGGGDGNVFVTKLSKEGKSLVYSTYIGGSKLAQTNSIAVDSDGYAYITGRTDGNYPTTTGAYQTTFGGQCDAFVTKVSKDGRSLVYSTYLGGNGGDYANGIAIDSEGNAYITGTTEGSSMGTTGPSFPVTSDAYQSTYTEYYNHAFISKLSSDGKYLIYSTYLGGNNEDSAYGISVDNGGGIYISGQTCSTNYPITSDAYQPLINGIGSLFISKLAPIEVDLTWNYNPSNIKLKDKITANLSVNNIGSTNIDVNVKFQSIDSTVSYVPYSLNIQHINQSWDTIPESIYISNIPVNEKAEISLDLKYINEIFPERIVIIVEIDYDKSGAETLMNSKIMPLYIDTGGGPNYIPGCNILYNLEINNKLQTTTSGTPIVYYKSGTSYIYIEPKDGKYVYKVLSNPANVTEYQIIV